MKRLNGKVAVVAGSATGMGRAGAMAMAAQGAAVVFADVNEDKAHANAEEVRASGGRATAIGIDIALEEDCRRAVALALKEFGKLDILHSNAAAFVPEVIGRDTQGDILNIDLDVYDRTLAVNLRGYLLMARAAVPEMLKSGGGSVIHTSSSDAFYPEPVRHSYSISKAGVNMLTMSIATAYGKRGIRCNAVCPGLVMTMDMNCDYVDIMMRHTLTPEPGSMEDLANVFVFLASDESRYINGALIKVDGGLLAHAPFNADLTERFGAPSSALEA